MHIFELFENSIKPPQQYLVVSFPFSSGIRKYRNRFWWRKMCAFVCALINFHLWMTSQANKGCIEHFVGTIGVYCYKHLTSIFLSKLISVVLLNCVLCECVEMWLKLVAVIVAVDGVMLNMHALLRLKVHNSIFFSLFLFFHINFEHIKCHCWMRHTHKAIQINVAHKPGLKIMLDHVLLCIVYHWMNGHRLVRLFARLASRLCNTIAKYPNTFRTPKTTRRNDTLYA